MADLTDTEEKLYAREITAILVQYADEMKANSVDASQRIANLDNGSKATDAAETAQAKTDAANNDAIALVAQLRTANYKLVAASAVEARFQPLPSDCALRMTIGGCQCPPYRKRAGQGPPGDGQSARPARRDRRRRSA